MESFMKLYIGYTADRNTKYSLFYLIRWNLPTYEILAIQELFPPSESADLLESHLYLDIHIEIFTKSGAAAKISLW